MQNKYKMATNSPCKWRLIAVLATVLLLVVTVTNYREKWMGPNVQYDVLSADVALLVNEKNPGALNMRATSTQQPLRRHNGGIASYSEAFFARLRPLVQRKAGSRDPELIQLIREIIDPPSSNPTMKLSRPLRSTPQSKAIQVLLGDKRGGFYIECGALDGERSSNTIHLESSYGWTGLLVEMDPYFYTQLLGKARKSWTINACLSPHPYVTELVYNPSKGGMGQVNTNENIAKQGRAVTPCFPLESILLALNQTHVNYFSLDVEGVELNILKTIPFDKITIDTLSVEYRHGADKELVREYMIKYYKMHRDIVFDDEVNTVFVKDFIFVLKSLVKD